MGRRLHELNRITLGIFYLEILASIAALRHREIARALGRSDGATKVLLHRAIRQLEGIVSDADQNGSQP